MSIKELRDLQEVKDRGLAALYPQKPRLAVGSATCGQANGAAEVTQALIETAQKVGYDAEVVATGCLGFCAAEPLVDVWRPGYPRVIYRDVTPQKASALVTALAKGDDKAEWALCRLEGDDFILDASSKSYDVSRSNGALAGVPLYGEAAFFARQVKVALRNCGFIRPTELDEYIARGGFFGLYDVLHQRSAEEVIGVVTKSGIRGRGGAGFPTGKKWAFCRGAAGDEKYIICNADEGDPGAYMDRSVLEGDPYSVLEGMITGAYAIGNCRRGYIYVRGEYPHAIEVLTVALEKLRDAGLLGEDILGAGFDFDVEIARGAGAFVCGEETALLQSIEGLRGMPRPRPPYPAQSGLFGKPTVINNVETWANIPAIINRGAEWFAGIGTEGSKGTKVFSLVGNVTNTGLVEVPMGAPMHEVIFDIGGGIPRERAFKAVQTGGPSGGCLPASQLGLHIDFDALKEAGSMMGSGGMIVMDEHTCAVEMARYFLSFCKDESCGKCTPCRDGIPALLDILERITAGEGKMEDLATLEELGHTVKDTALCGLGQTAPNPLLTTLRYFRDEYEAHIKYKKCPGAVCKALVSAPCHHVCPVGMDPPAYIGFIAQGKFAEAYDVITDASPFPGVCGRVCHYPCEFKCTSGDAGDPIAIRALKRFVSDFAKNKNGRPKMAAARKYKEKVAVIGSGPAGLSCAYKLARNGYAVTVFEALPVAGGMLAVGIPAYRLPRDILEFEIENVKRAGVEIKTNAAVGSDLTIDELRRQGYKAFFIAAGAHKGLTLGIPGEDAEGVVDAVAFLRDVNLGRGHKPGNKVGVIGGGNAAVDAARTALRMGAAEVHILYRRTRQEMPAQREEVEAALTEGIQLQFLVAPTRVVVEGGRMVGLELRRMELGDVDAGGRRRPVPVEGSAFTLELDALIPAISQRPDLGCLEGAGAVETTKWDTIVADEETQQTAASDVFAGGDVVSGPATVTGAMAQGKRAAAAIHRYLRGEPLAPSYEPTRPTVEVSPYQMTEDELEKITSRPEVLCRAAAGRARSFDEAELCLSAEQAMDEAKRCLRCDASAA